VLLHTVGDYYYCRVTLNVTVATRNGIHQSADFRLTDAAGNLVTDSESKQVHIQDFKWSSSICYTGLAEWRGERTGAWLVRAICVGKVRIDADGSLDFDGMIEEVSRAATEWLRDAPGEHRGITFTVGAFQAGRLRLLRISNDQSVSGVQLARPADRFTVFEEPVGAGRCIVTGSGSYGIPRAERRRILRRLSTASVAEAGEVLATVNAEAAARDCRVSEACGTTTLARDGSSGGLKFGKVPGAYFPHQIGAGATDMVALLGEYGIDSGQVRQWSSVSSGPQPTQSLSVSWPKPTLGAGERE
jgi:hypothetical protein